MPGPGLWRGPLAVPASLYQVMRLVSNNAHVVLVVAGIIHPAKDEQAAIWEGGCSYARTGAGDLCHLALLTVTAWSRKA